MFKDFKKTDEYEDLINSDYKSIKYDQRIFKT